MSLFKMSTIILNNFFRKPYTKMYPVKKWVPFKNTRGSVQIEIDKCIFCGICQKRCPAQAIVVNKPGKKWEINRYRCIMCNYCAEVCPKKCLSMDQIYTAPVSTKQTDSFIGTASKSEEKTDSASAK